MCDSSGEEGGGQSRVPAGCIWHRKDINHHILKGLADSAQTHRHLHHIGPVHMLMNGGEGRERGVAGGGATPRVYLFPLCPLNAQKPLDISIAMFLS